MKTILVFAVVLCAFYLSGTWAIPVVGDVDSSMDIDPEFSADAVIDPEFGVVLPEDVGVAPRRQKRATCDLLSWAGVNHSACAANCILKKFRGGYCNGKQVCVCRK